MQLLCKGLSVLFFFSLTTILLTACSQEDPYQKYTGYWEHDTKPRVLEIRKDGELYKMKEIRNESDLGKNEYIVLKATNGILSANNGIQDIPLGIGSDPNILLADRSSYVHIDDAGLAAFFGNLERCKNLEKRYELQYNEIDNNKRLSNPEIKRLNRELTEKVKSEREGISKCDFFIKNTPLRWRL